MKILLSIPRLLLIPFALVGYAVVFAVVWALCKCMDLEEWMSGTYREER